MDLLDCGTGSPLIVIPGVQGRWEYVKPAIDALAGIVDLLAATAEPDELEALRRDLAQLRMAYVQGGTVAPPDAPDAEAPSDADEPPGDGGPGEQRPPIWTPGGEV